MSTTAGTHPAGDAQGQSSPSGDADSVPARYSDLSWQQRLAHVVDTMREVSSITDPMEMSRTFGRRMRGTVTDGHLVAISRRGLDTPFVRVTRNTQWDYQPNPWKESHRLPLLSGGIFADLIYADQPRILAPLRVSPDDPAYPYLSHARSALAVPQYENGASLNMVLLTSFADQPIDPERFPDVVLSSNLVGRSTRTLVLSEELRLAYEAIDRELRTVQDIQLSLLPRELPRVPGLELASHYQTSHRAGGDYYDFFELPAGQLGVLVGDVSGHGTPAAVLMAIVHAVAHLMPGEPCPPHRVLDFVNRHLCARYTLTGGNFVTMLYGVYDPAARTFTYANAGHPHPLVRGIDGTVREDTHPESGLPLGIIDEAPYRPATITLRSGEALVLFTDGITEAFNADKQMFGDARLHEAIARASPRADDIVSAIVQRVGDFAGLTSRNDDRTLVVASLA